jgi:hypothetical protein
LRKARPSVVLRLALGLVLGLVLVLRRIAFIDG